MFQRRNKMLTDDKGFTLVELVIILVILSILAVLFVPSALQHIDRTKNRQILLNGKSCLIAAQAEMSSIYGEKKAPSTISSRCATVKKTAGADGSDFVADTFIVWTCNKTRQTSVSDDKSDYKIGYAMYKDKSGKTIYYNGSSWESEAPTGEDALPAESDGYKLIGK